MSEDMRPHGPDAPDPAPHAEHVQVAASGASFAGAASPRPVPQPQRQQVPQQTSVAKPAQPQQPSLSQILAGINVSLYTWSAATDEMFWTGNAPSVLGLDNPQQVGTLRLYQSYLDEDGDLKRASAIERAAHGHVREPLYAVHYAVNGGSADRPHLIWIEDTGRCILDEQGRLVAVRGMIRRVEDPRASGRDAIYHGFEKDDLTGVYSRDFFVKLVDLAINDATAKKTSCGFFIAAIDNLDMINEAFGFDIADQVISQIATRLEGTLRKGDLVGRLAGNKFGLLLRNCAEQQADDAAHRMLIEVNGTQIATDAGQIVATVSLGGVVAPRNARNVERAICCAQDALTLTKERRRGGVNVFQPSAKRDAARKLNLEIATDLIRALSESRVHVALQPILATQSGEIAFHECLSRVLTRGGEIIPASGFMGFAEKLGLVQLVDNRVLDLAVDILNEDPEIRLSLNVGIPSIADLEWFNRIAQHVLGNRALAQRLIVEITETEAIRDLQETCEFIGSLHDLGCKVALDDFGAGFTSYRNLRDLGVDIVKIDGSFMQNLHSSEADQMFVRTLVELSHSLNIETVAEWVEHEEDAELLKKWGVTYMQGHLYGEAKLRQISLPTQSEKTSAREETMERLAEAAKLKATLQG